MNEDIFTINSYTTTYTNYSDPFYLLPFGDVHFKNPNHHTELWEEWCDWAEGKERAMFLGMGDYLEWFSDSERRGIQSINLHQSSQKTMDDFAKETCDEFYDTISFMKGKCLGMLEGNHFYQFGNGMTSTQYLCQRLECKYLGATGFVRIRFKYARGNESSKIDVFVHHGKGASRLVGGSLNTVQQMAECAEADIHLMGHDHKKSIGMSSRLSLTDGRTGLNLKEKKILYARTGSFLKGYEPDKPSYVAKSLLNPSDLGTVKIELTPRCKTKEVGGRRVSDKNYIDIHASL
jgi:predicted phosphodiesterase